MEKDKEIPICVLNVTDKPIRVFREQSAATIKELPVLPSVARVATPTSERDKSDAYNSMSEILVAEKLNREQESTDTD